MFRKALGNVKRQFILTKCRLPWYVQRALLGEHGGARQSFNEASTSARDKSPSKCQRPLVLYPILYDGDWNPRWMSRATIWMRESKDISYGLPSNAFVERQSQRSSLAVSSEPNKRAKTEILALEKHSGIWSITAIMRICSLVKRQKKRCRCPKGL